MSFWTPANREDGFTLIEVLVAVAILAVLASLVSLTFSSTFRILHATEDAHGREHQARTCLTLITEDLMMARLHGRFPWNTRNAERDGQPSDLLAFVSASHVRYRPNVPEADLTRVLYTREGDRLARFSLRNLYGVLPAALERVDVATGVVAFNVRYYDGVSSVWVDEWDGQSRKTLPRAVMIELTLLNSRQEARTFVEWAVIPAQSP
ncbi:MAG: type II secretion system protein GspJ [Nitrospirota bacterium]